MFSESLHVRFGRWCCFLSIAIPSVEFIDKKKRAKISQESQVCVILYTIDLLALELFVCAGNEVCVCVSLESRRVRFGRGLLVACKLESVLNNNVHITRVSQLHPSSVDICIHTCATRL